MPKPSVGRTVHYVSHGTPVRVGLAVLNPEGMFFNLGVPYDEPAEVDGDPNCSMKSAHGTVFRYCACGWREAAKLGGTWHWPERVEE